MFHAFSCYTYNSLEYMIQNIIDQVIQMFSWHAGADNLNLLF